jgi:hypothetical protein
MGQRIKLSEKTVRELEGLMCEYGFEIWNAGCTHRIQLGFGDENFIVRDSGFGFVKEYKDLNFALNFLLKKDEE